MSWISRKYNQYKIKKAKLKDLEQNFITIFRLCQLRDEYLIIKDDQLARKEQELKNLQVQQYAILAAITLGHNGEYLLDKILFDIVTDKDYNKLLSIENLPDGSSKLTLVDRTASEDLQRGTTQPENPNPSASPVVESTEKN